MSDLSFWRGVSNLLNVEQRPPSLCSGRREPQFHWQFPFQLFLCITLVEMGTCKKPQEPVYSECKWGWKRARNTLNTKEGDSSLHIRGSQPEDSATYLCASTQCPSAPCSPHPKPCLLLLWDQYWGRAVCGLEKGKSMNYGVFSNQGEVQT